MEKLVTAFMSRFVLKPAMCAQVRKFLHVVLCFSPVGDKFRIRARQFPALVNCTAFDWFHTWPAEALVSVATRFLVDIPAIEADTRENIAYHMAFAHQSVAEASRMYLESVRRYNYTTPKVSWLAWWCTGLLALPSSVHAFCRQAADMTVVAPQWAVAS